MNKKILVTIIALAGLAILILAFATNVDKRDPIIITSHGSYQEMSLDDLIAKADLIVMGDVDAIHPSRWNTPDGKLPAGTTIYTIKPDKLIFTDADFNVNQIIKGQGEQQTVHIRSLGGVVGQDRMIANSVVLEMNKTYLLFLKLDTAGSTANIVPGHYWVLGGYQGVYEISNGTATSVRDQWQLADLLAHIQQPRSTETPMSTYILAEPPTETPLPPTISAAPTELFTDTPTATEIIGPMP